MKRLFLFALTAVLALHVEAKPYILTSPDGTVATTINVGESLTYDISIDGRQVLKPSALSMTLTSGAAWGINAKVQSAKRTTVDERVPSPFYRQAEMRNHYNQLTLTMKGGYQLMFRAYDEGIAYRFVGNQKKDYEVKDECVAYNLAEDYEVSMPMVGNFNPEKPELQFRTSFESHYTIKPLSQQDNRRYAFLPILVDAGNGVKLCLTETNLEHFPGLYLQAQGNVLKGVHAPYPKEVKQGGHNELQMLVLSREEYIARETAGRTLFPWRIAMLSRKDTDLAMNNLSYLLAEPNRLSDISWIKPGKVAWDWWNDWNIYDLDFEAGINDQTYRYYIDFAAEHGIEYVILDEGWAVNKKADLFQVIPEIHLQELVDYGRQKGVGIILWAGYYAFERDMEHVFQYFSEMGVKGFKVDFMDRDDQMMTSFYYRAAEMAAQYHMMLDFHGAFKPSGMTRTYPNVLNFEGVAGLENLKWAPKEWDQVTYDCHLPFTRQLAGPMDYTQGAMHNATRDSYFPSYSEPMSQGTRCHQLGLYMILESPFSMLCDSPTNYKREAECTAFIAAVPTTWDETRVLQAEYGRYVVTARRKGDTWYVGGITNWDARDITFCLSDLVDEGQYKVESFVDGTNAHRKGTDYRHEAATYGVSDVIRIHMAPGGGFALKVTQ